MPRRGSRLRRRGEIRGRGSSDDRYTRRELLAPEFPARARAAHILPEESGWQFQLLYREAALRGSLQSLFPFLCAELTGIERSPGRAH